MSTANQITYPMATPRGRVLIVDDTSAFREVISRICESDGYEVLTAKDGLDALNQLVEPLPSVIITDLIMPRMSGFEFLAIVRQRFPDVPVLAISAQFDGNDMPRGVLADAYLPKRDITLNQLRTKITELVADPPRRDFAGGGRFK